MAIFNSYVKLQEGTSIYPISPVCIWGVWGCWMAGHGRPPSGDFPIADFVPAPRQGVPVLGTACERELLDVGW